MMFAKKVALMGSIRFWTISLAAISQIVKIYVPDLTALLDIISVWFLTVAGVGTVDKLRK